jgi:inner membrane protein
MTNGGMGIAFFWPFDNTRYFLPWRPILVSPVTVGGFFHERSFLILQSELLWVWLPTILVYAVWRLVRYLGGVK